jgi:hypothetical protein
MTKSTGDWVAIHGALVAILRAEMDPRTALLLGANRRKIGLALEEYEAQRLAAVDAIGGQDTLERNDLVDGRRPQVVFGAKISELFEVPLTVETLDRIKMDALTKVHSVQGQHFVTIADLIDDSGP